MFCLAEMGVDIHVRQIRGCFHPIANERADSVARTITEEGYDDGQFDLARRAIEGAATVLFCEEVLRSEIELRGSGIAQLAASDVGRNPPKSHLNIQLSI